MLMFAPPVLEDMHLARPALKAMHDRHPAGFTTLTWVLPGAGYSMDGESRRTAAKITSDFSPAFLAQATLIEGSGFQGATVRAIISGIDMMARSRAPRKVFGELPPSIVWALSHQPQRPGATETAASIQATLEATRKPLG